MGVRRNISRGGSIDILLILFRLLTMQCKCTFTKRFTLSNPLVYTSWTSILNLLSEMFSTLRLSSMPFLFINCLTPIFWALSTNKSYLRIIMNDRNNMSRAAKKQESYTLLQNCFKQWEVEIYVDKAIGQLTKVGTPRRLKNTEKMNYEKSPQRYSFALSAHLEIRTKPLR